MSTETNHKWYVINAVIGQERKIVKTLNEDIEKQEVRHLISEVIIPTETSVEMKRGKKVNVERKACPSYILVKMELNEKTLQMIRSISGVAKFLGRSKQPMSISEDEVMRMLNHLSDTNENNAAIGLTQSYVPGEIVEIQEGGFAGFSAYVDSVDDEKSTIKVSVSIFGRETPVELNFKQVKKIIN